MTHLLRTPDDWLSFFREAAGDGTTPLGTLEDYLEMFREVGVPRSIPEWDDQGWDYALCEIGGYRFEFTAEIGWTDAWPVDGPPSPRTEPTLDVCARAFREALLQPRPFDRAGWRKVVRYLGQPVFEVLSSLSEDALLSVWRYGPLLARKTGQGRRWEGPFRSLAEALGRRILIGPDVDGVWCDEWPEEDLIRRLEFRGTRASLYLNHRIRTVADLRRIQAGNVDAGAP